MKKPSVPKVRKILDVTPTWSLIRDNAAAPRSAAQDICRQIDSGSQFVLLTGAGGEGKSTILKQVAILLAERGDQVFFVDADETVDLRDLLRRERGKMVVLVDDAEDLINAEALLTFAERRRDPTHLVLGARANEWHERHRNHPKLQRLLERISVSRLSDNETNAIARLIFESGASGPDSDEKKLAARLRANTNGFLLAAMLVATEGRQLQEILRDVVETISNWADGEGLIKVLATVVAHESRRTPQGHRIFCSQRLFREVMGSISDHRMYQLCNRLTGEVSVAPRGGYRVETRHPVIAEVVARVLFNSSTPLISEVEVCERIVRAAGRLSRDEVKPGERKLLTSFPLDFMRRGQSAHARQLFRAATEADPHDAPTWQAWALLEKEQDNVGDLAAPLPGTARYLFKKGTDADPHHAHTWQAWALLEKEQDNVGDLAAPLPGTARYLFKKGTDADPHDAPTWQAWALLEKEQHNVGDLAAPLPGTARYLFKKGTDADPHDAHLWQAWALLEKEQHNVGDLAAPLPGTARYLFKKGTDADPHRAHLWQAWALLEKEQDNIGGLAAPLPGTARYLFKKGTDADPRDAPTWQAWALLEKEQDNVGDLAAPLPGTARYLFKKGTDADPHHAHSWQAWALLEKEQDNVGDLAAPLPGTARYLFKKGTDADPHHAPTWQAWALLEFELGFLVEAERLCRDGLENCPVSTELRWVEKRIEAKQPPLLTSAADIEKHIQAGDISRAKSELAAALAKNPIDPSLLRLAAELSRLVAQESGDEVERSP